MQETNPETPASARIFKAVYTIVRRPPDRRLWLRVGTAKVLPDQSLMVKLDASPTNAELYIREWEPYNPAARRAWADESFDAPAPSPLPAPISAGVAS